MNTFNIDRARAMHDRNPYDPGHCGTCDGNQPWPCPTATALGATGNSEWINPPADNTTLPIDTNGATHPDACADHHPELDWYCELGTGHDGPHYNTRYTAEDPAGIQWGPFGDRCTITDADAERCTRYAGHTGNHHAAYTGGKWNATQPDDPTHIPYPSETPPCRATHYDFTNNLIHVCKGPSGHPGPHTNPDKAHWNETDRCNIGACILNNHHTGTHVLPTGLPYGPRCTNRLGWYVCIMANAHSGAHRNTNGEHWNNHNLITCGATRTPRNPNIHTPMNYSMWCTREPNHDGNHTDQDGDDFD